MKKTPYRRAVIFERVLLALFLGVLASGCLATQDADFFYLLSILLLALIFLGIWYGLMTCPACGRPVSWRKSRFEELSKKCRGCGADLDQ
jgi:hypothetical protein